jgi:hypothetical protein
MSFISRWRNKRVASDLRAAADLIEKIGWAQRNYFIPGEGYCVLGAINTVTVGNPSGTYSGSRTDKAVDALYDLLSPKNTLPAYVITEWNDLPTQTAEKVTATLRAAAERVLEEN